MSPANSFGYMDGGIDAAYLERFGAGLQSRLQKHLREHHHGELAVGEAVVVETHALDIPWLVSAPTMRFAYDVILGGRKWPPLRPKEIYEVHEELLR